jgi:DNA invertase Pin-like site-specific DNA recombinase
MDSDEALHGLLGDNIPEGYRASRLAGLHESMHRREVNSQQGGQMIQDLIDDGMSYREIEKATGYPRSTLQRWVAPPKRVSTEDTT